MQLITNLNPKSAGQTSSYAQLLSVVWLILALSFLVACTGQPTPPPTPTPPALAEELVFYNWPDYMPQAVLDAFTEEYGVKVKYLTFDSDEEALANIQAGQVYDVVVLTDSYIPTAVAAGLLAEIDYRNVLNFDNISDNFRNLAFDPDNAHSVPYNWGSTGLVVRSDLADPPITKWADLWEPRYTGKIAFRKDGMREPIGAALKSMGYSINSENPVELEAALARLLELQGVSFIDAAPENALAPLLNGEVIMVIGWPGDVLAGREQHEAITYVLPEEGPFLWGENFVIPANSPNKYTAELFINFVLRPEQSAQTVNELYYPSSNKAAQALVDPAIRNDPVINPPDASLKNAEVLLPLSPEGEKLYADIWQRFVEAQP